MEQRAERFHKITCTGDLWQRWCPSYDSGDSLTAWGPSWQVLSIGSIKYFDYFSWIVLTWSLATRPSILRIFSKVSLSLVRNTSRLEENNDDSNYHYLGDLKNINATWNFLRWRCRGDKQKAWCSCQLEPGDSWFRDRVLSFPYLPNQQPCA